jgi:AmiR/NasT family two-component response regulator
MLSFQLYTHQSGGGALNLLGRKPREVDHAAEAVGAMLATHAAIALIAANKERQFKSALASRDLFGQAKGIIMNRYSVDAVRAFEMIIKLSQDSNTPARVIAQQIIDS